MSHTHTYRTALLWEGSTGAGYEHYTRAHRLAAPPAAPGLDLTSDPAFGGDPDRLNPEQLLLAAASSCQLLSFLAVASRARIDVVAYADDADAVMPDDDRPMRLTRITLRPVITVGAVSAAVTDERLRHLVVVAHRESFNANSLRTDMTIEPTFVRA
jgi:organic hydroperoxide reductase OsmC/OhrA